ncbi:MAG: MBL fold metallo-hydrolase [Steroidobacteraceae bacterium]|nr:MBL fold metallo-hydrolase [Steroidobacteraceae bacterium]
MTTRRVFVASALAATATARLARASTAAPFVVPEVDSLSVQVLVDNATFGPFLPDVSLRGLKVERIAGKRAPHMTRNALMGEFGLSLLARSQRGSQSRAVMVDFGYSPEVLANNLSLLGIDTSQLDAAVLSHGHLDHYGGFASVFGQKVPARHLPLFVGGEETFCERVALIGEPPPLMGTLDRKALARAGLDVKIAGDPAVVAEHAFTTGLIPLDTFERAAIPTQMRPGVGCDANALTPAKRGATQLVDDGEHELATCYAVKGLGLVVIASCSHRGVLNSVERARAISGIRKVHAVIGGFHLVRPRTDDEARRTVAEFVKIDPAYVVPMHCTGEVFIAEALRVMPDKVVRAYVGTRFTMSAA